VNTRTPTREERQLALLWLAAVVGALALRPLWLALAPHLRPCIFRSVTGVQCPTCGTTRAATAFLEGDLLAAFAANPLAAVVGLAFVAGAPLATLGAVFRWPIPVLKWSDSSWLRVGLLLVIAINWLYVIIAN
jgi:hypothetical protein